MNIGVIGLGLIGGSMAKCIKAQTGHKVFAFDIDDEVMLLARLSGAIDAALNDDNIGNCDYIFIALAPQLTINWLRDNGAKIAKNAIVIDFCGTKRLVCEQLGAIAHEHGFSYIGGHPMAGKEQSGFVNSSATLYNGASMILVPGAKTDITMLEGVKNLFIDLGFGMVTFSTAEEHDRIIAFTSQLAHIVSSAYIKSPEAQKRRGFSAGSFKDMTRVARLDENLWSELCMDNSDFLVEQLDILIDNIAEYREALNNNDKAMLTQLFKDGREKKAQAGGN